MVVDIHVNAGPVPLLHHGNLTAIDRQEVLETTGVHASTHYRKIWGQCMLSLEGPVAHIEAAREFVLDIIYLRSTGVPAPEPGQWGWQNANVWAPPRAPRTTPMSSWRYVQGHPQEMAMSSQ